MDSTPPIDRSGDHVSTEGTIIASSVGEPDNSLSLENSTQDTSSWNSQPRKTWRQLPWKRLARFAVILLALFAVGVLVANRSRHQANQASLANLSIEQNLKYKVFL